MPIKIVSNGFARDETSYTFIADDYNEIRNKTVFRILSFRNECDCFI